MALALRQLRPPVRYSLRTFFVLLTVLCLWLGWNVQKAREQAASVRAVHDLGGWCQYDFNLPKGSRAGAADTPWSDALVRIFGLDFFHNIESFDYRTVGATRLDTGRPAPAGLAFLTGFPRLKSLAMVSDLAVAELLADDELKFIGRLRNLEYLSLSNAYEVSDVGVLHLRQLRNLRYLNIERARITDESLKIIAQLPRLEQLSLIDNALSNAGLAHLQGMTQLQELSVGRSKRTTGPSLTKFKPSEIDDRGLAFLLALPELTMLNVRGCGVTVDGVAQLRKLPNLHLLHIGGTQEEKSAMREILPNCTID